MDENDISYLVRKGIFKIYNTLGPGLLESVYLKTLAYELQQYGLTVNTEVAIPLIYENIKFEAGFRIDILANNKVIIEIKSVEELANVHHKQVLTYLRLSCLKLGLLVNFNTDNISSAIVRKVNNL